MALSEDEIDLLRESFRLMQSRKERAGEIFYDRLFALAPELKPMFKTDMAELTEKVMMALGAVIGQIQNLENCNAMTTDLALRHVGYGVVPEHYARVGGAVYATLADTLEEHYTPEIDVAWHKAYAAIAEAMIKAAYGAEARYAA